MLVIHRQHRKTCTHKSRKNLSCNCPLWLDWAFANKRLQFSLHTRSLDQARLAAKEIEAKGFTNAVRTHNLTLRKPMKKREADILERKNGHLEKQSKKCAICGTTEPGIKGWCLDHDHTTGNDRQVLCSDCNSVLGFARDDERILLEAVLYLRKHKTLATIPAAISPCGKITACSTVRL